jgi:hypothetical protein
MAIFMVVIALYIKRENARRDIKLAQLPPGYIHPGAHAEPCSYSFSSLRAQRDRSTIATCGSASRLDWGLVVAYSGGRRIGRAGQAVYLQRTSPCASAWPPRQASRLEH